MSYYTGPTVYFKSPGVTVIEDIYEVQLTGQGCPIGAHPLPAITPIRTADGVVHVCRACSAVWLDRRPTPFWFREHRGTYADSLATQVELVDRIALVEHVAKLLQAWGAVPAGTDVVVEPYTKDPRDPRWAGTWAVRVTHYGVIGFTNGPVP